VVAPLEKKMTSFNTDIDRLLAFVKPQVKNTVESKTCFNMIIELIVTKIMRAVNELLEFTDTRTVTDKLVDTATRILFPDGLSVDCVRHGYKAIDRLKVYPKGTRNARTCSFFNITRIEKLMMSHAAATRKASTTGILMAGIVEYLVSEIMEYAGKIAVDESLEYITAEHIKKAVVNDFEIVSVFGDLVASNTFLTQSAKVTQIKTILAIDSCRIPKPDQTAPACT